MRLRVWLGLLCLMLGACAHLPERVRVETDQGVVEVERRCPDVP